MKIHLSKNTVALSWAATAILIHLLIGLITDSLLCCFLGPLVIITTTSLVVFGTQNLRVVILSLLSYLFIAITDFVNKLVIYDVDDKDLTKLSYGLLFYGSMACLGLLVIGVFRNEVDEDDDLVLKLFSIGLFIGLVVLHDYFFRMF